MPLGFELAESLSSLLNLAYDVRGNLLGDKNMFNMLRGDGAALEAARSISQGIRFSNSIDEYIDRHKDPLISKVGKLAIAHQIIERERSSKLWIDPANMHEGLQTSSIAATWYIQLARMLFRATDKNNIKSLFEQISVIDFNYDRCLQHFLWFAMRDAYAISLEHAASLLQALSYTHPYGSIGGLGPVANAGVMPFGFDRLRMNLVDQVAAGIKTYTEQVDTDAAEEIKEEFSSAHTLVFLGFGFHEQNMRLLKPNKPTHVKKVLATAKGVSENDRAIIAHAIDNICGGELEFKGFKDGTGDDHIIVRDLTCVELFQEYRLTLQAA